MTSTKTDRVVIEDIKKRSHIAQTCRLWDVCFGSPYDIHQAMEYVEKHLTYNIGAVQDGTVMAVAAVIMFDVRFGDQYVPCGGVAGVATHPSFRRQGLTKKLIAECLKRLHADKVPISSLWPFSYPFYENLGWSTTDLEYKVEVQIESLLRFAAGGSPAGYREIAVSERKKLYGLHDQWCDQWNMSIKRKEIRWDRLLLNPQCNWLLLLHQEGYMLINLKNCNGGVFEIREWCYLSEAAFVDGLSLLSQLDSQYGRVRWLAGEVDSLLSLGVTYPVPTITAMPGMMSRVVDVKSFEKLLPKGKLDAGIRVIDPMGVSDHGNGSTEVGPGQLLQLVTGFGKKPAGPAASKLFGAVGDFKAFSAEKY